MILPTPSRLVEAWRDLIGFLRSRQRHEFVFALLAVAITGWILFAFWRDSTIDPGPRIVYVQNWRADRPDSEIIAQQKKERIERQKAEAERRASFQRLENMTSRWL